MIDNQHSPMDATKKSQLISALREGVAIVQMICFKELKSHITSNHTEKEPKYFAKLTGAIINEIFGTQSKDPVFVEFRKQNWGIIEQELLNIKNSCSTVLTPLTDSLRIQVLCDHQEGSDCSQTLVNAKNYGFLLEDREIPLPSTYMAVVRTIGAKHNLVIAPTQINAQEDQELIH